MIASSIIRRIHEFNNVKAYPKVNKYMNYDPLNVSWNFVVNKTKPKIKASFVVFSLNQYLCQMRLIKASYIFGMLSQQYIFNIAKLGCGCVLWPANQPMFVKYAIVGLTTAIIYIYITLLRKYKIAWV